MENVVRKPIECGKLITYAGNKIQRLVFQFIEDGTQVIPDGSFTEKQARSNFFVTETVSDQAYDLKLPFVDVVVFQVECRTGLKKLGNLGNDFISENSLSGVNRVQCRDEAFVILFEEIAFRTKF